MTARALVWALLIACVAAPSVGAQRDEAFTAYRSGRYEAAIDYWDAEVRAGRASVMQVRQLLVALAEVGRYERAEQLGVEHLARADGHQLANRLGEVLYARGRVDAARQAFERAVGERASDALRAELNLAVLEYESGRRDSAMRRFDHFLEVYNEAPSLDSEQLTAVAVACTYLGLEDPQLFHDAVRAFDEAITADPGNLEPRLLLGELFLSKYNSGEAGALIDEVRAANPSYPRALAADAQRAKFDGSGEVLERLREALEVNPSLVQARVLLAQQMLTSEQFSAAAAEAEMALEVNPRSLPALAALAAARYLQRDKAGFEQIAERAMEINPQYGELFNVAAEMAVQNRLYSDAVRLAERAVAIEPAGWAAHGTLGINQLRVGQIEQGRESLERAFSGDPFNVWFKNTLDLLDTFERYRTLPTEHFELFIEQDRSELLSLYMGPLADEAWQRLTDKYGYRPAKPVRVEVYARHADFSVRTVGLAGLGALGVAFGPLLAVDAPAAAGMGDFNWGSTLWHEIAHVVTLGATDNRVPRWFTEGLSVYEQRRARVSWGEEADPGFLLAYLDGKLLPVSQINDGFVRPSYPAHVMHSYLQASLVCELIERDFGFDAIRAMLDRYRRDATTPEIVTDVLGVTPEQLDGRFVEFLEAEYADQLRALRFGLEHRVAAPEPGSQPPAPVSTEQLQARVRAQPDDFLARLELGVRLYQAGDDLAAVEQLTAARDLFPGHAGEGSAYGYLARIYEQRGELEHAVELLQRQLSYNESSYMAYTKLAELQQRLGRNAEALDTLERTMYINPYEIAVHLTLAALYEEAGAPEAVVRERKAVLALDPVDRAQALYLLAMAHVQVGESAAARLAVLGALEIAPGYRPAQELLLRLRSAGREQTK